MVKIWKVSIRLCNVYVLPDDDKRYAIETCRSSEKCFKKVI